MTTIFNNKFFRFTRYLLSLIFITTIFVFTYVYSSQFLRNSVYTINISQNLTDVKRNLSEQKSLSKGLRSPKINARYDTPQDISGEIEYKDVKLISTKSRPFSNEEISILKLIIDLMPQKVFDYRPWGIVSTSFNDNEIAKVNPDGVAFSSGPYVFVGDITFAKQNSYDTGTFRGLMRVISHEFTHSAQFFETKSVPDEYVDSYLESSDLVQDWIKIAGWTESNGKWTLKDGEKTTDYGKSGPVEDMADSVGSMVIGEEYSISQARVDWVLKWLNLTKEEVLQGTIPLSSTIKQRRVENDDTRFMTKYKNADAISQDLMNFQSTQVISRKDFANFYATEFKRRGWSGSINTLGVGEFIYLNKYKVNMEMDANQLRVVTLVMTVY
jgi:hypothetical protein